MPLTNAMVWVDRGRAVIADGRLRFHRDLNALPEMDNSDSGLIHRWAKRSSGGGSDVKQVVRKCKPFGELAYGT